MQPTSTEPIAPIKTDAALTSLIHLIFGFCSNETSSASFSTEELSASRLNTMIEEKMTKIHSVVVI